MRPNRMFGGGGLTWLTLLCASGVASASTNSTVLNVGRIHTPDGVVENGAVVIADGKIVAVGAGLSLPADADVKDYKSYELTAGLIDANCAIELEGETVGQRFPIATCTDPRHCRAVFGGPQCPACNAPPAGVWQQLAARAAGDHDHEHDAAHPAHLADPDGPECVCGKPNRYLLAYGASADVNGMRSDVVPPGQSFAEQSSEIIPHLRVIDALDLTGDDFRRLARSGVTTVYVAPDSGSVIGARGAIVKTAGPLAQRIMERDGPVQAAMGMDPSSRGRSNTLPPFYGPPPTPMTRRPTTRMGVEFVFRKALYDTRRAAAGIDLRGADQPPPEALPTLESILARQTPLRIQARLQHDIYEAARLAAEFDLPITLVEALEAYKCLPLLERTATPVIFGPNFMRPRGWRAVTGEATEPRLDTPALLAQRGIRFALTANDLRGEEGLERQGMLAVRYGLPAAAALRAMTQTPAELLGISSRCGTLAAGQDADLVVWSAAPFTAAARPLLVMVNGQVVHEE